MADQTEAPRVRPAQHILPTAGTMLGVCSTIVGLVKLLESQAGASRVDELGGLVAGVFLFSAIASYASMRSELRAPALSRRLERAADLLFVSGLLCLALLAIVFAYELV